LVFSCQNNREEMQTAAVADKQIAANLVESKEEEFYQKDSVGRQQQPTSAKQDAAPPKQVQQDWDKKIVKSAVVNAEVKDYNAFYSSLRQKVKNLGGYIAGEEQSQTEYKIQNSLTIKVPVDQFDNAMTELSAGTILINEKKVSTQDVTEEMVDTRSRMEAKKQVRQRYIDLLKQAKNMEDIISVEKEINGIQEQIESAGGRINYLSYSSTFSTIHFTYYQVLNVDARDKGEPGFGLKLKEAFGLGWDWVSGFFIGLISVWPLLLLLFAVYIVYKKRWTKVKQVS
jgi:hypothetical protein